MIKLAMSEYQKLLNGSVTVISKIPPPEISRTVGCTNGLLDTFVFLDSTRCQYPVVVDKQTCTNICVFWNVFASDGYYCSKYVTTPDNWSIGEMVMIGNILNSQSCKALIDAIDVSRDINDTKVWYWNIKLTYILS